MCGDTDPERDHQGRRPKPTAHYRRFRRSSYAPRVGTDSDMHGCQSGSDSHITDCPGVTHTGFRRYSTSPLVFMRSVEMAQFSLFSPLVDKFHLESSKRVQRALNEFFAKIFGGVVEKLYFCTDPRHTRPIGTECHPAEEDLAQGTHVMPSTNLEAGFLSSLPYPSCDSPDIPTRREGVLGPGSRGRAPVSETELLKQKISFQAKQISQSVRID